MTGASWAKNEQEDIHTMSTLIGIDIGGTFTDVVALDAQSGAVTVTKVPSTPSEYSDGFFHGLEKIQRMADIDPHDILRLVHGTTVATNAILEKKGSRIGILTTKGFRDVLIIGRGTRSILYNVNFDSETPDFLCPRELIREVGERVNAQGEIQESLNEEDVLREVDFLIKEQGVTSIAVCYLFSFFNAANEERTYEIIKERYPEVRVSLSCRINPRFREYERTVVTAFDAYIGPVMDSYLSKLENRLEETTGERVLQLMQSRGGITSAAMCAQRPVLTLLSGPAAGVIGGRTIANLMGRKDVLTLDLGGTSNDVALIRDGKISLSIDGMIGSYPCRQAMMDISTIGAGGGSIAWVDDGGWLRVGPQSAGSYPGPACYSKGGTKPTYTDASLTLGYLKPGSFAGGEIQLNDKLALDAIKTISEPLGMDVYDTAAAIHRIMHNRMADQLRLATVKRGYDPRNFSIIAFGGAGPIAACRILSLIDFKEVIIPPTPGVMAAIGLLSANIEHEEVVTVSMRTKDGDLEQLRKCIEKGLSMCNEKCARVGMDRQQVKVSFSAEMRYVGQSYELEVPFPEAGEALSEESLRSLEERFHHIHEGAYKQAFREVPVELIALRVLFTQAPSAVPSIRKAPTGPWGQPESTRRAFFDEYGGWADCDVYDRKVLVADQCILGPAVIQQSDTTTVLYPGQSAKVDAWGNLVVTMSK